jgi:hypothetical protein
VELAAQAFDLLLELQLLSFELAESKIIGAGPAQLVLNGLFQGPVTGSKFTNPGI